MYAERSCVMAIVITSLVSKYNLLSTGGVYILGLVVYLITSSRGAVVLPNFSPGSKLNELSEFP